MMAVRLSLQEFILTTRGCSVLVKSDNSTVVAYLNKEGGTRSRPLCRRAMDLILWCRDQDIMLRAVHIPGIDNAIADSLSRGKSIQPTEWALQPQVVQQVFARFGQPAIDLFATRGNKHLPVYCARRWDNEAFAIDALSIRWSGMAAYAFPPLPLIHQVLLKVATEECLLVLVVPFWPRQPWFPLLASLAIETPVVLPVHPELLRLPGNQARFHDIKGLKLTAWKLSSSGSRRRVFLLRQLSLQAKEGEIRPTASTIHASVRTSDGVEREVLIQPEPLCPM
jgi:hypothetical protein